MAELRARLYQLQGRIGEHLAGMDPADLEKTLDSDPVFRDTDAVKTAFFLCTHDFYHAGQIAVMRRILGCERPFG